MSKEHITGDGTFMEKLTYLRDKGLVDRGAFRILRDAHQKALTEAVLRERNHLIRVFDKQRGVEL